MILDSGLLFGPPCTFPHDPTDDQQIVSKKIDCSVRNPQVTARYYIGLGEGTYGDQIVSTICRR